MFVDVRPFPLECVLDYAMRLGKGVDDTQKRC